MKVKLKTAKLTEGKRTKSLPKLYTIEQIADCTESSERTVRRWIEKGWLVVHRINGMVRISEADFLAFLAAQREP